MLRRTGSAALSLSIGLAGGAVFYSLHVPLPWTLGSLTAAALLSAFARPWFLMPRAARFFARPIVGVIAGSAFTSEVLVASLGWWDAILIVFLASVLIILLGNVYFRRIGKLDRTTAFFASSPGGLGEMTLLGGALGGDMRRLVLIHTVRIVAAVVTIPFFLQLWLGHPIGRMSPISAGQWLMPLPDLLILFLCSLAGYWLSRLTRFPAGMMVYTLVFSALTHIVGLVDGPLPAWVTVLIQVAVGSIAGRNFAGFRWSEIRHTLVLALIWAFAMIIIAAALAMASSWLSGRPFEVMLLTLAPGGMVEMITITFALGIDVAFVVTCQMWRLLLVMTIMPITFHYLDRKPPGSGTKV